MRPVTLLVPHGKRSIRLELPPDVARWLAAELTDALGGPKPSPKSRRPVRLRRGRWVRRTER